MNILSFCPEFGIPINDYFMQNSSYSITFLFITPFYFLHNFKYKSIKQQLYIYINVHTMHKDVIFDNDNKGGRNYTNEWKSFSHIRLFETWDSPGQNTGVGSFPLLQGIFPGIESRSLALQADSLPTELYRGPEFTHAIEAKLVFILSRLL